MKLIKIEPIESTECPKCLTIEVCCDECHNPFDAGEQVYCTDDDNDLDEEVFHYHKKCRPMEDDEILPPPTPLTRSHIEKWRMN